MPAELFDGVALDPLARYPHGMTPSSLYEVCATTVRSIWMLFAILVNGVFQEMSHSLAATQPASIQDSL